MKSFDKMKLYIYESGLDNKCKNHLCTLIDSYMESKDSDKSDDLSKHELEKMIKTKYPNVNHLIEVIDGNIAYCSETHNKNHYKRLCYVDEENHIVGTLCMYSDWKVITDLFVGKKYRNHGFATKLITCAVNKYGMKRIWVFKNNENAIKLYKKLGFKEEEKDPKLKYDDRMYYFIIDKRI